MVAPRRRPWESLSLAYRKRLERGEVTRSLYESGARLTSARGHSTTPERPARADSKADYLAYRARRAQAMHVMTTDGQQVIAGMTTAERSLVARHLNATKWYLSHGRANSVLPSFAGDAVTGYSSFDGYSEPVTVELETRFERLNALQRSGALDFLGIYADAA